LKELNLRCSALTSKLAALNAIKKGDFEQAQNHIKHLDKNVREDIAPWTNIAAVIRNCNFTRAKELVDNTQSRSLKSLYYREYQRYRKVEELWGIAAEYFYRAKKAYYEKNLHEMEKHLEGTLRFLQTALSIARCGTRLKNIRNKIEKMEQLLVRHRLKMSVQPMYEAESLSPKPGWTAFKRGRVECKVVEEKFISKAHAQYRDGKHEYLLWGVTFEVSNQGSSTVEFATGFYETLAGNGQLRRGEHVSIPWIRAFETRTRGVPIQLPKQGSTYSGFYIIEQAGTDSNGNPVTFRCRWNGTRMPPQ
jgi:hypothetical protein